eukprot:GILI01011151.1.p1 GENE.GILI01011151.1~~GILI01011151.1.p1  ORF type:complete len:424 (-),score=78.91 GILI01011151.1:206-1318(-)
MYACTIVATAQEDDDIMAEEEVNEGSNAADSSIAAALAGLTNLFSTGVISCEQELIPPEESCCHPPGADDSPDAPSECFAPPMPEEKHPWDSSQTLKEAMQSANRALSVEEFERIVFPSAKTATNNFNVDKDDEELIAKLAIDGTSDPPTKALVIDTRCAAEFVAGHVPNAVFGGGSTDQFDKFIGTVHSDHNIPVVFVSSSEDPKVIDETAQRLVVAGLTNLQGHLKGGMATWTKSGRQVGTITRWNATVLAKKLRQSLRANPVAPPKLKSVGRQALIDLREPCASDSASLPNSESIPVTETVVLEVFHRAQHETDPNHPLVLYCSNGFRSLMVASALKAQHPKINVVSLEVGFDELVQNKEIKKLMKK